MSSTRKEEITGEMNVIIKKELEIDVLEYIFIKTFVIVVVDDGRYR